MNKKTERYVGTFLSIIFLVVFIANCIDVFLRGAEFTKTSLPQYTSIILIGILALILIFSTIKVTKASKLLHIFILFLTGCLTVYDSPDILQVHGEIIVIFSLLLARTYGFPIKKIKLLLTAILLLCIFLRFINFFFVLKSFEIYYFTTYLILVLFLNLFLFVILSSVEEKTKDEARRICSLWQKEQVYNDIGKNVFSTFIHDYNVPDIVTGARVARDFLKSGDIDDADEILDAIIHMGTIDYHRLNSVRDRVVMSHEEVPRTLFVSETIGNIMKGLKNSSIWNYDAVICKDDTDFNSYISIIPIDFVGIVENFLKNSLEACFGHDADVGITISNKNRNLIMEIWNTGPKIPWAGRDGRVDLNEFRPGRSTKEKGTGWGVYTSIRRIEEHKGSLKILSTNEKTRFIVTFPVVKEVNV